MEERTKGQKYFNEQLLHAEKLSTIGKILA
jgi:hypothetical protein